MPTIKISPRDQWGQNNTAYRGEGHPAWKGGEDNEQKSRIIWHESIFMQEPLPEDWRGHPNKEEW